jgi:hypothetical protein
MSSNALDPRSVDKRPQALQLSAVKTPVRPLLTPHTRAEPHILPLSVYVGAHARVIAATEQPCNEPSPRSLVPTRLEIMPAYLQDQGMTLALCSTSHVQGCRSHYGAWITSDAMSPRTEPVL